MPKTPTAAAVKGFCNVDQRFQRFTDFKTDKNNFAILAYGHAGRPKVLHYSLSKLVNRGAILASFFVKGTIFSMDVTVALSVAIYFVIGGIVGAVYHLYRQQTHDEFFTEKYPNTLLGVGFVERNPLDVLSRYMNMFIPFILGLYVALTLERWWTLRYEGLNKVLDAAQNIALVSVSQMPDRSFTPYHDQITRYALASVSLIVKTCRGDGNVDRLGPDGDGLLTDEELEICREVPVRPRPALLWGWILALANKVYEEQAIAPGKQRDVVFQCVQARTGIAVIWTYLGTQLPFTYVHLVTFLVNVNNLIAAVRSGVNFVHAMDAPDWWQAGTEVTSLGLVTLLYQGLLSVSYVVQDPFGEDLLDFPVMAFQEYCNAQAVAVATFCESCPSLAREWGKSETVKEMALRKGIGKLHAERLSEAADLASSMDFSEGRADREEELKAQLATAVSEQTITKDKLLSTLKDQRERVESQLGQFSARLQTLENRKSPAPIAAPAGFGRDWCSLVDLPLRTGSRPQG